jgi:hypothetical protein
VTLRPNAPRCRPGGRRPAQRLARWLALAVGLLPGVAHGVTLFGSDFLSPVQIWDPGYTLLGEALSPRLDLDGLVRVQFLHDYLGGAHGTVVVPQVDLQANLQLTATQRMYALFRPLERGDREPTFYRAFDDDGWTGDFQGAPEAAFYEGQPFNWIAPDDRLPLDLVVAGGRVPFFLHNGLWFNNFFDGFTIGKNNIQVGELSNLNVLYFLTRGQTQPGLTLDTASRREAEKNLTGVDVNLDWIDWFVEASWAVSYDNDTVRGLDQNLDRNFWALSITRTLNFDIGVSFRAMGSTGNATADAGELFALESQYGVLGTLLYATVFGATEDWIAPSVQGSALSREGILYTFDRLVATPQLNPRGAGTAGGVVGDILNPRGHVTLAPEFGWLVDQQSPGNDQLGLGLQLQADLASLLVPGDDLAALVRRGLLYGALARFTVVGIRNENRGLAGDRYDYGTNLELIYQF